MSSTATLSLATIPDYFANADTPPEPAGAYVWWRFGDVRPNVDQVEAALNAYAEHAGIPWKAGDRVEISPSSAMRAAASGFKYNTPNATVEAKVVFDDGVEGKVCLLRKRLIGVNKGATIEGETVCEVYIGLHSLNVKPVIVAKDANFGESSPAVQGFLADLERERTTIGYLTLRPAYLVPALRAMQAIGQKSRAGFYWVPQRSATKVNGLAAFMKAIGSSLRVVLIYAHQGTIEGLEDGTRLHLSDLVEELQANVSKLQDQAGRGRTPRADSMATAEGLILEIRETGDLVREVLGLRMDDVMIALDTAEREFKALSATGKGAKEGKATPDTLPDAVAVEPEAAPKRRGRPAKSATPTPATHVQEPVEAAPVAEPEPTPVQEPAQDCEPLAPVAQEPIQDEPLPFAPTLDTEPAQTAAQEPTPEPTILPEPVTATLEPTEDEGVKWPSDDGLKKLSRDALRAFCKDARVKALCEARGVKGIMSFNPDQLRGLIVMLRDGIDAE